MDQVWGVGQGPYGLYPQANLNSSGTENSRLIKWISKAFCRPLTSCLFKQTCFPSIHLVPFHSQNYPHSLHSIRSLSTSHSIAGKIKHTLNVLHRACVRTCCMHSVNISPPKTLHPQNPLLFVYNIPVYLKSLSGLRVKISHLHTLSHFHNDNNANNNNSKRQGAAEAISVRQTL